jgi:hypothetical protein
MAATAETDGECRNRILWVADERDVREIRVALGLELDALGTKVQSFPIWCAPYGNKEASMKVCS